MDATGETVTLGGAGRTDSGVHGLGQVFALRSFKAVEALCAAQCVEWHLQLAEERVSILEAAEVADQYDSRFSATKRHYLYRIINRPAPLAVEAKPCLVG